MLIHSQDNTVVLLDYYNSVQCLAETVANCTDWQLPPSSVRNVLFHTQITVVFCLTLDGKR